MKILEFPETRQVFNFDCGSNAMASILVFAGVEEREDRIALLARTTSNGTSTAGVLRVMRYYALPYRAKQRMKVRALRRGIDAGFPTLLTLQAYRESNRPYRELWDDGHWVVAIGYDKRWTLYEDPASYHRTWLADEELMERWHDIDRGKRIWQWGCTVCVSGQYKHDRIIHMD
jgi:ABC-type bacteriocin/lantibiotic exporter with double-glycine peptidase domain